MTVPVQPWSTLTSDQKRVRTLEAANDLFSREGIDAPMPALAEALGVGVGSIYRQVGPKDDLIAALVIQRSQILVERFSAALGSPDPWAALETATHETVDDCIGDALSQTAWDEATFANDEVRTARVAATESLAALVERAREAGALRDDASHEDLRIAFRALRDLGGIGPDSAHRLAELVLRGMHAE
ncbi:MAG: TetR/AcrR family transcriptional regulator [Solirubrobacterales bacterium]